MGYVKHDVLIVTDYGDSDIYKIHKKCIKLFGSSVSEIRESKSNDYFNFVVFSSGGKSGGQGKMDWEEACEKFFKYLLKERQKYFIENGKQSKVCDAVHLTYGGDDWSTSIDCPEDF